MLAKVLHDNGRGWRKAPEGSQQGERAVGSGWLTGREGSGQATGRGQGWAVCRQQGERAVGSGWLTGREGGGQATGRGWVVGGRERAGSRSVDGWHGQRGWVGLTRQVG